MLHAGAEGLRGVKAAAQMTSIGAATLSPMPARLAQNVLARLVGWAASEPALMAMRARNVPVAEDGDRGRRPADDRAIKPKDLDPRPSPASTAHLEHPGSLEKDPVITIGYNESLNSI